MTEEKKKEDKIQFFGAVDRKADGTIGSDMPAYYFDAPRGAMAMLEEEVNSGEREIEKGAIPADHLLRLKADIKEKKKKLEAIQQSKPVLSGPEIDKVKGWHKDLGEKISSAMYTYKEDNRRIASPQEEVRRMTQPCIEVPKELVRACGMDAGRGGGNTKVNRNIAEKMWKIAGKNLDEPTNVEALRREG